MADVLQIALCGGSRIRVIYADVTEAARSLESRHLAGPAAGCVLAEGLAAAAVLSVDAATPEEALCLRLRVAGPVGGLEAEACGNGDLRGYTRRKVLEGLDEADPVASATALGDTGSVALIRSRPGLILNQTLLHVHPPCLATIVARYYSQSLQIPAAAAIAVRSDAAGVMYARALVAERMPDTDSATFVRVLEAFHAGAVAGRLATANGAADFKDLLACPDLTLRSERALRFHCRCSRARMLAVVGGLPVHEVAAMLAEDRTHHITCHMCGQDYALSAVDLRQAAAPPAAASPPA